MDNIGEALGTNSAIKGSDGVSVPPLYIFFWFYLSFLNLDWLKRLRNKQKIGTLI